MVSIHFKILALDYSITKKVIRYILAKKQFSWCSLNPYCTLLILIYVYLGVVVPANVKRYFKT